MLSWPPGRRETDGVWAKHWYAKVQQTTTFSLYRPKPDASAKVLADCNKLYERLYQHRLVAR